MRLVLDTNVWLDWLVFDGSEVVALKRAHHDDAVEIVIDAACREELARVLAYPEFALTEAEIGSHLAEIQRLAAWYAGSQTTAALPRCADPHDQKLLILAASAEADALITRDKALLKLGRRTARRCGFAVIAPRDWRHRQGIVQIRQR